MENTVTTVTALPDWLREQDNPPSFLSPVRQQLQQQQQQPPQSKITLRDLEQITFSNIFESALDRITGGEPLTSIIESDHRGIDYAAMLRWVMKDPVRKARYYEAQEIGSEFVAGQMLKIADAENSLEDVQRSTLRINTRKFLLATWNRKRFGEVKQVEHSGMISITQALADADNRVFETYDGEAEIVDDAANSI